MYGTVHFSEDRNLASHASWPHTGPAYLILVVEDEFFLRVLLADYLQGFCGFVVIEAESVGQAIALLETRPEIDLVFSDIHLAGKRSGIDLAHWIHANRPLVPVILTTGDNAVAARAQCPNDLLFAKPYDCRALAESMCDQLARN
jgi:CheY-like chemotaxis protein